MKKRRTLRGSRLTSAIEASTGSNASRNVPIDDIETQPLDSYEEEVPETPTDPQVRKRGKTSVGDIWNLPPGERIIVELDEYGHPVEREASLLAKFIRTIVQNGNLCPVDTEHWGKVPKCIKDNILKIIRVTSERKSKHGKALRGKMRHHHTTGSTSFSTPARRFTQAKKWVEDRLSETQAAGIWLIKSLWKMRCTQKCSARTTMEGLNKNGMRKQSGLNNNGIRKPFEQNNTDVK
ncbi:hypothetical protein CRG98_043308 [Punica granatum]|uniref:Uncharacterized protein n=1 Tax=Punica granatum TaxID=22663 RepID=A0A2I0HX59_PUNGR|nr:hypothetical protein CRG98_043308 [Punica granatum]